MKSELLQVAEAALEYIDALPKDLQLPAMPGFDRDWANGVVAKAGAGGEEAPDASHMMQIEDLIAKMQKTRDSFGNTCVYIRRGGLSWGAVALNRRADDEKHGVFDLQAQHDRDCVSYSEWIERLRTSRDEAWQKIAQQGERISELLRFNNEFEERARVAGRQNKALRETLALIKRVALDMQPADVPKELAHIVRLCIDAGRVETATAQAAEAGPGIVAADQYAVANTPAVIFWYRNHRGEEGYRRVIPIKFWYGVTEWHPLRQMLLRAFDTEKSAERDFAVADMKGFVGSPEVIVQHYPNAVQCWSICEALRADEGNSVELLCDNPDFNGQPDNAVGCCGGWTGWDPKRFTGNTILEALKAAHQAMIAAKVA